MVVKVKRGIFLLGIALLCGWQLDRAYRQFSIAAAAPLYDRMALEQLTAYADTLYNKGFSAYLEGDRNLAVACFQAAVKADPFQIDAWLRLAEIASNRDADHARRVLRFTDSITADVQTWKWHEALLARELGMEGLFLEKSNSLLRLPQKRSDTFQMLDVHFEGHPLRLLDRLEEGNREPFLEWLMRWDRLADTMTVWDRLSEKGLPSREISHDFVHFLVDRREVQRAAAIWKASTGIAGFTNGGFEEEVQSRGFDWRVLKSDTGKWRSQRVNSPVHGGGFALEVVFKGNENLDFFHLGQVVAVQAGRLHHLSYARYFRGITSDQGPYIEVEGYDCQGLYAKGPMMLGASGWQVETLSFTPPSDCRSAVVRLRRIPSRRFDSLLAGTVWLDDFELTAAP